MYHAPLCLKSHKNHNFKPLCLVLAHARSRNFHQGGSRSNWQKKLWQRFFFFFFFLVLSLFYRSQMVYFKENYHFHGSRGGPTFTRGVQVLSGGGGGVQLLIPYRNPYNLWFLRGGGVRTPCPPSGSALVARPNWNIVPNCSLSRAGCSYS